MARKRSKLPFSRAVLALIIAVAVIALGTTLYLLRSPSRGEPPASTVARNEWNAEAFVMRDGFLRYEDAPSMIGIDVSTHQGIIDWQTVADAGVEFAILRVGYRG